MAVFGPYVRLKRAARPYPQKLQPKRTHQIPSDAPLTAGKTIPARTLIAYRRTRYQVAGITIRIGRRTPGMDRLLTAYHAREAVLITAHNPFSRRMPPGWNHRMQSQLTQALRRRPTLRATGTLLQWSEDHLLALGPANPALKLARRFRQNCIVIIRPSQPARLNPVP